MSNPIITHADIASFATEKVNLKSDLLSQYRDQVNNLRRELETHIKENPDFGLVKMLNSGSVAKGTALKTIHDMDVAVYLKQSVEIKEDELLSWLVERLRETYPNLKPDQFICPTGAHCVTISFKGSGLDVDVVPVLIDDNTDDYGYLVTEGSGDRVLTNIPLHLDFIQKRKDAQPDHFAQVVRLMKWWVRQQQAANSTFRFKSFMVELVCAHLADSGLDMSVYARALQMIFSFIVQTGLKQRIYFTDNYDEQSLPESTGSAMEILDPVNPTNNAAMSYSENDRQKIVTAATEAFDALTEAQFATTKERSVIMWKTIFGPSFNP